MTVFIADIYTTGHHLTYINLFTRYFQRLGYKVIILLPKLPSIEVYDSLVPKNNLNTFVYFFEYQNTKVGSGRIAGRNVLLEKWRTISEAVKENQREINGDSFVFFPYLDAFMGPYVKVTELNSLFSYSWSGLYMNPPNCRIPMSFRWLRKGLLSFHNLLKSKNCRAIFVYDPLCADLLSKEVRKPIITIPDIIDDSPSNCSFKIINQIKERAKGRKIISLLGSISKRKGLLTFLRAIGDLENQYFFLIAGKLDTASFTDSELAYISSVNRQFGSSLLFYNERIPSESDFNALIEVSDILFAAYHNFTASSNLISKAAVFNRPIIVSRGFLMQEIVEKYDLGCVVESNDVNAFVSRAISLLSNNYFQAQKSNIKVNEYKSLLADEHICALLSCINSGK